MEDLFPVLIIVLFIVLPLVEKALKGGKGKDTPPRSPGSGAPAQRRVPGERKRPEVMSGGVLTEGRREQPESAADMVPEDLWAVLTGEQRSTRPPPRRAPAPPTPREGPPVEAVAWKVESERDQVDALLQGRIDEQRREVRERDERIRRSRLARPEHLRPAPRVVSLETPLGDPDKRHERFHDKMDAITATEVGRAGTRRRSAGMLDELALGSQAELRRALVLQEVLGMPRSMRTLEDTYTDR
ncbi:MAG: hypothetical protein WEA24_06890 [Gemmatimonadota bacterium]